MSPPPRQSHSALDDLPLYLPRVYYALLGVVERKLADEGLDRLLKPGMGHVLLRLYEQDDCIIKEIGQSVKISNGTLTSLLRRMEKQGLIRCRRCAQDGRAVRVSLTSLGRSIESRVRAFHADICKIVQAGLTTDEVQVAKRLLSRILHSLKGEVPDSQNIPPKSSPSERHIRRAKTKEVL